MDTFETSEMSEAIDEAANSNGRMNAEAAAVAREKGWIEPEKYDYDKYSAPNRVENPSGEGEAVVEDVEWASSAAKYEWNDEFGDIGPADHQLECMLFHSDLISRVGIKFET
jgi:ATP-dependent RNA helicase DDX3X